MKLKKLTITGEQAHFKVPNHSKIQKTFEIPPIATVIGILQNIFGKEINNFTFGYTIESKGINKEILTIYKEINPNVKKLTDGDRFTKDLIFLENLISPKLIIYTDIEKDYEFLEPLTLGKANYLASVSFEDIELIEKEGLGFNQYTTLHTGSGMIRRINTITEYNSTTGFYDYKSTLVRENKEFEYHKFFDEDEDQNIFLWTWKDGEIYVK